MSRQLSFFIFLFTLATLSWWALTITDPSTRILFTTSEEGPDQFMEKFISTTMNEQGIPKHQLVAERLLHYPNEEHSNLEKPMMTFFKPDGDPWIATASKGTVQDEGNEVFLAGDVNVTRPTPHESPVIIDTKNLHIQLDKDIAKTTETVIVQQGSDLLVSIGMDAHFTQGEIDLLSHVRGMYVPQ